MILALLIIVIIIIVVIILTYHFEPFANIQKFKAPPSLTIVKRQLVSQSYTPDDIKLLSRLDLIAKQRDVIKDSNIVQTPTFFNCNEKWVGCLPRPLYQGTCGSCWGFAAVTCLSSRFYIESCGNSGCLNYPQIDAGSLDDVIKNINYEYAFNKTYLESLFKRMIKTDNIGRKEWIRLGIEILRKMKKKRSYELLQILVNVLDFQSLGSLDLTNEKDVKKRLYRTFDLWKINKNQINIKELDKFWRSKPINLSPQKLITCCTTCLKKPLTASYNPSCVGGSLIDAWTLLRDTGTVSTLCIGYNIDNYVEGDKLINCSSLQGPFYSFCTGYVQDKTDPKKLQKIVNDYQDSGIFPVAIKHDDDVPWKDPQLFRFRAKNAYLIDNNVQAIQREIIQRGPVTSGFTVYKSFQEDFGTEGLGGQKYTSGNPLGSSKNSLIYMNSNPNEQSYGGHAITIVGWGSFKYKDYLIPYWTCLNSWGVDWGHTGFPEYNNRLGVPAHMKSGGYFWIVRGINNCGIEENVCCGQPNLENISYPGIIDKYGWGAEPPVDVKFINKMNTKNIEVNEDGDKLDIELPSEGGSTFIDITSDAWKIKSMESPSPYLMFWPGERPKFKIGKLLKDINETDNQLIIENADKLRKIQTITKNPLMFINNEQIQLINVVNNNTISVYRAVNTSILGKHLKGSVLFIFPYQNLSSDSIKKLLS